MHLLLKMPPNVVKSLAMGDFAIGFCQSFNQMRSTLVQALSPANREHFSLETCLGVNEVLSLQTAKPSFITTLAIADKDRRLTQAAIHYVKENHVHQIIINHLDICNPIPELTTLLLFAAVKSSDINLHERCLSIKRDRQSQPDYLKQLGFCLSEDESAYELKYVDKFSNRTLQSLLKPITNSLA